MQLCRCGRYVFPMYCSQPVHWTQQNDRKSFIFVYVLRIFSLNRHFLNRLFQNDLIKCIDILEFLSLNCHYRLRASKSEPAPGSLTLAVCPRGLKVCPENNPPSIFLWSSIGKLSFERKKYEIRTAHEKLTLYTTSDEKSRLLLALCKAAHQFSMAVAPRLNEAKREEEERQRWDCDQRVSVISSTSSNTTSGIVSDRVHSEDELEIMITSPPAPSTESLALAHLLDSAPASSRTSAASATAALATLTLRDEEEESNKQTLSECSTKTTTSGKCAGSQCSSSCSTVVVTPVQTSKYIKENLLPCHYTCEFHRNIFFMCHFREAYLHHFITYDMTLSTKFHSWL